MNSPPSTENHSSGEELEIESHKFRPKEQEEKKRKKIEKVIFSDFETKGEMIKISKVISEDDERRQIDDDGDVRVMVIDFRDQEIVERQKMKRKIKKEKNRFSETLENTAKYEKNEKFEEGEKSKKLRDFDRTTASKGGFGDKTRSNLLDSDIKIGIKGEKENFRGLREENRQIRGQLISSVLEDHSEETESEYEPRFLSNNSVLRRVWELDRKEVKNQKNRFF